jgi:hypothetical protein
MEGFIATQSKKNEHFDSSINEIKAHNKLMENTITQISQQLSQLNKSSGQLPGQTEQPQRGHINAVTLRSGKELKEPELNVSKNVVNAKESEEEIAAEKPVEPEIVEEEKKESETVPPKPYVPPVPFPQRLAQAKLEKKYGKFLEILQKLHINIPFMDAITEMPSYAKFLKDILSRKRKIEESSTISLTTE